MKFHKKITSTQEAHAAKSNQLLMYSYFESGNSEQRGKRQFNHKPYSSITKTFNKNREE